MNAVMNALTIAVASAAFAALTGCNSLATPSRSQTINLSKCKVTVFAPYCTSTNGIPYAGLAGDLLSQNMAIENSGTETNAQTPTQSISPTTTITTDVPINKVTKSALGDSVISMFKSLLGISDSSGTSGSTASSGTCTDGSCTTN